MSYTSKDIKVLDEIEHIRLNPSMYIGDTSTPTHLVEEALDNALDECFGNYAKIVAVILDTKNSIYSVVDNGRGLPYEDDVPIIISTKLFSGGKFKGSKTAYTISCLTGDTEVLLIDGTSITLKEMAENPDKKYFGLSLSKEGFWKCSSLLYPQITGYTKKLIKITLDNDREIKCTENHLFMMRDGSYIQAKDLKINDSLMPCYYRENEHGYMEVRRINEELNRKIKFERRHFILFHKIAYTTFNGRVPKHYQVHHIDENRKNNTPENLKLLYRNEHIIEHVKLRMSKPLFDKYENAKGLIEYAKSERGRKKSREMGKIASVKLADYARSDRNKIDKSKQLKEYNRIEGVQKYLQKQKVIKFVKTLFSNNLDLIEENWEKYRPYGIPKFSKVTRKYNIFDIIEESKKYIEDLYTLEETNGKSIIRSRMFSILKKIGESEKELTIENYNFFRNQFDPKEKTITSMFGTFENFIDEYKYYNHSIKNIEIIELDEETPVYDIHVPEHSNFALSSEIVVHNSGKHGIGLVALNSLSTDFSIEIYRDKHASFKFEDCILKEKTIEDLSGNKPFSTKIQFTPDKKFFQSLKIDVERIRKRLLIASVELPNVHFVLMVDDDKEVIKLDKNTFFNEMCLADNDTETSKIFNFFTKENSEEFNAMFCFSFSGTTSPKIYSSVNLLPVDGGGTHINLFSEILRDFFISKAKKANLKFQASDCLCGLRAYISLELMNPEYGSQSKDKLTNKKESLEKLSNKLTKEIETYFSKNNQELEVILNYFAAYRADLEAKKHKVNGNGTKRASTKMVKLRDCTSSNGEIFIVEGDSAAGSLIQSRDPKIHAIFPLKGKIPNIVNAKDILKNKEVGELVQAFGCGIGKLFDINKLRYSKIICASDNDFDGMHIACLITMVISVLFPDIVKTGKFYIATGPLYAINEPKNFVPLWNEEELNKARADKKNISYFKGLGEMNPAQIKICLMDEKTRKLLKLDFTSNLDKMFKLFSDPNEKRKLLKGELFIK